MIRRVRLTNFKSHKDTEIVFPERGLIAIGGKNYAGKTSILQALGLALFNWKPSKITELIRRGSKKARVEVELQSKLDGEFYVIVREIRTSATWIVLKDGQEEARGSDNARNWLRQHYKLKDETKLELLFSEAVGVPQGNFARAFELSDTQRKETFDPLLGLSEYREAHRYLRDHVNVEIKQQRQTLEREMAELQGRVNHYRPLKQQIQGAKKEEKELEGRLKRKEREGRSLDEKVKKLEKKKLEVDEVVQNCREEEWNLQSLKQEFERASKSFEEAEKARCELATHSTGYQHYVEARERLRTIEKRLDSVDSEEFKARLEHVQQQLVQQKTRFQAVEVQEQELVQAREELQALEPKAALEEDLEYKLRSIRESQQKRELLLEQEHILQQRIAEAEKAEVEIQAALKGCEEELQNWETWQKQENSLLRQKQEAEVRLKVFREYQRYQSSSPNLCPFLGSPCQNATQGNFVLAERLTSQEARVRLQLENAILPPLQKVQEDLDSLEESQRRLKELQQQWMLVQRDLTHFRKELITVLTELQDLPCQKDAMQSMQAQILELGQPRQRVEWLKTRLRRATPVQEEKHTLTADIQSLQQESERLEKEWLPLKSLEEEAGAHRRQMSQFEQDYLQYCQKEERAAAWQKWHEESTTLAKKLSKQEKSLEALQTRRNKLRADWNVEEYETFGRKLIAARQDWASIRGTLQRLQEMLERQEQEMAVLEEAKVALQAKEEEARKWRKRQEALSLVSRKIKDAGPEIADRVRHRVSRSANAIYSSLVDSASEHIEFSNTYGIQIRDGESYRAYETLAGSEQMSAALAIRMGLLEETSELDFVFFDEPTTHLDSAHRDKLASQLNSLNIPQKFVISHDDSFQPYLSAIFQVSREHGVSRVDAEYF